MNVERNGFTNLNQLGYQLAVDLTSSGAFEVVAADKLAGGQMSPNTKHFIIKATTDVDPLAEDDVQPWVLVLDCNDSGQYINLWACTPTQIDDTQSPTVYNENQESGRLSPKNSNERDVNGSEFFTRHKDRTLWSCFKPDDVDISAIPLSYHLSVTDHGIFFSMWAESFDKAGDCFNWFLIQRPVDCNTGLIITEGKSPLICMFSQRGLGDDRYLNDMTNAVVYNSIYYFVVREDDVNKPIPPVSACIPTADSFPIINPLQQVSILEDNSYVIRFPQGFSTPRYLYDYKLDMIAYTSADVLSQWSRPSFTVFGEETARTYKALNANVKDNKGMRILCQIGGKGI